MVRIQPGIEFPIIPEDLIVMEEAHTCELHPSGEREFPNCLNDTGNETLSYKSKFDGQPQFMYERVK
jgi:hypothetical protein